MAQPTMEEAYHNWMINLAQWVTVMVQVGKEVAGETFLNRLEEVFYKGGLTLGAQQHSRLGIAGTDCAAIGRIFDAVDESLANYWDGYVENSASAFEKHLTTCPVAEVFSRAPEICTRLMAAGGRGLATSVDPNATFRMDECMAEGDRTCHYRVEIE